MNLEKSNAAQYTAEEDEKLEGDAALKRKAQMLRGYLLGSTEMSIRTIDDSDEL